MDVDLVATLAERQAFLVRIEANAEQGVGLVVGAAALSNESRGGANTMHKLCLLAPEAGVD